VYKNAAHQNLEAMIIGKTSEELVAIWNEKNPEDQVVFSEN